MSYSFPDCVPLVAVNNRSSSRDLVDDVEIIATINESQRLYYRS
jgi:hypothetical protein